MRKNAILAAFLLNLCGCFPLEVDVNDKGELLIYRQEGFFLFDPATKKVRPILGPGADTPVFARFAPNGREILAVVLDGKTGEHRFDLISLADGTSKVVYKKAACCYTRFSPNGRFLALTRMATREHKSPKAVVRHEESELDVIDLKSGVNKRFTQWKPHVLFRWFRDSKRILAVVIANRDEDGRRYFGHLSEIDIGSGKVTRIASVASSEHIFIDLAPDNGKALVVAKAVGPVDKMPALAKDDALGICNLFSKRQKSPPGS